MKMSGVATLCIVVALAGTARAQAPTPFLEACQAGDWAAAELAWSAIEASSEPRSTSLDLRHVEVLLHLGRRDTARASVEAVLGREPRNLVALALLARLRAGESAAAAKELLLDAAREGFPVLREIRASKELATFGDDPAFVLAAMRASAQFDARLEKGRDPFALPRIGAEPRPREPRIVKPTSAKPERQLADYIEQGNALLRGMVRDLRDERLAEVSVSLLDMKALCDAMRREPVEDFARNADELWTRAVGLDARARKLLRVKELGLGVTGIVLAPRVRSRAIVTLGKETRGAIYEEGDEVRDADGERLRGLRVTRIAEGSVSFRYEDVDFVRELRRGP